MKKLFVSAVCGVMLAAALVSCGGTGNEEELTEKEAALKAAMTPYIEKTVVPTYKGMADAAITLADDVAAILAESKANPSSDNTALVEKAGNSWTLSRKYWEQSEAFLYGPADYEGIDPHIDSWPFDETGFNSIISDATQMEKYKNALETNATLDEEEYGVLGYHSLEFVLFTNGKAHKVGDFTTDQWTFMTVVANDLRNQAVLLEACWAGVNNISADKKALLTSAKLIDAANKYPANGGFGSYMTAPGEGRQFVTYEGAAAQLIEGCFDIADEVGNIKIGTACNAAADNIEDRNYIESPYSLHSIIDFEDNIHSIEHAYFGSESGDVSLHDYIAKQNKDVDAEMRTAVDNAIAAIRAIPEPFYENAQSAAAKEAVEVVGTNLVDAIQAVHRVLTGVEYVAEEEE